uniref:Uncharacterized protein n=1 Tax=Triticum urartu TaxID=4572 RepID=A0A8R7TLI8_TRIUA
MDRELPQKLNEPRPAAGGEGRNPGVAPRQRPLLLQLADDALHDLAELPGLRGIKDGPHLVEVLGGLRGAAERGQEEVEELLAEARVGVAEEADACGGGAGAGAGGGAEDGGIEAEEEAVGVHGALQLRLPLLLPIRRHGRRLLLDGWVGAR